MTDIHLAPVPVDDGGEDSMRSSHTADPAVVGRLGGAIIERAQGPAPDQDFGSPETGNGGATTAIETPAEAGANQTGRPSRRNLLLGGLGAIASVVAGVAGFNAWNNGRNQQPGVTTQKDPTKADAEAGVLTPETSANIITYDTNPLYERLSPEQKAIIDELGAAKWDASYFDFPVEERRLFAQFMLAGQGAYTRKKVAETNLAQNYSEPVPVSESNTDQAIVDWWTTEFAELSWVLTQNGSSTAIRAKVDLALKMLDGLYTDEARGDDDYLARVKSLRELTTIEGANDGYERYTATKGTRTQKPVPGRRVEFYNREDTRQRHMVLVDFPEVAGMPPEQRWLCMKTYTPDDSGFINL